MKWQGYDPFASNTLQGRRSRPRIRVRPLVPRLDNVVPPIAEARRMAAYRSVALGSKLADIASTSVTVEHVAGGAGMDILGTEVTA